MRVQRTARKGLVVVTSLLLQLAWVALVAGQEPQDGVRAEEVEYESNNVPAETCGRCHRDHYATWSVSTHAKVSGPLYKSEDQIGCEACHGPGAAHAESGDKDFIVRLTDSTPEVVEKTCLECHEKGMRLYWRGSPHESRNLTCTSCHSVHRSHNSDLTLERLARFREKPREIRLLAKDSSVELCLSCHPQRRAQLLRSSHMPFREGQVTCIDCHNPHGTATPGLLKENSVNENCYKCHTEKRGPFLWEHPPAVENCLSCHEAHGSMHRGMLKARAPRLCQRCHGRSGHQTQPRRASSRLIFNLGCTNCHSRIHGSNHPSGARFQR